jgi:hypothetical protein
MPMNVVRLSKTIVAQHFKLLTRLRSCSTLQANVEILYIKETVFGVPSPGWSAAQWLMDGMLSCLVALAAA